MNLSSQMNTAEVVNVYVCVYCKQSELRSTKQSFDDADLGRNRYPALNTVSRKDGDALAMTRSGCVDAGWEFGKVPRRVRASVLTVDEPGEMSRSDYPTRYLRLDNPARYSRLAIRQDI